MKTIGVTSVELFMAAPPGSGDDTKASRAFTVVLRRAAEK
jgi:hypothetical protein